MIFSHIPQENSIVIYQSDLDFNRIGAVSVSSLYKGIHLIAFSEIGRKPIQSGYSLNEFTSREGEIEVN